MSKTKFAVFIYAVIHAINSLAYTPEEGNISTYFGPYVYKTNFTKTTSGPDSAYLGSWGAVVNGDINSRGSLEIGLFHLNKNYFRQDQGKSILEQTELAHITMGYRWWHTDIWSTSLTFFSDYSMGSPRIVHSDFSAVDVMDTSARDTVEYGFDLAAQLEAYSWQQYSLILDARYSLSLTNKTNEKADHYGLLIGLKYLYQDKK